MKVNHISLVIKFSKLWSTLCQTLWFVISSITDQIDLLGVQGGGRDDSDVYAPKYQQHLPKSGLSRKNIRLITLSTWIPNVNACNDMYQLGNQGAYSLIHSIGSDPGIIKILIRFYLVYRVINTESTRIKSSSFNKIFLKISSVISPPVSCSIWRWNYLAWGFG